MTSFRSEWGVRYPDGRHVLLASEHEARERLIQNRMVPLVLITRTVQVGEWGEPQPAHPADD